jgi:predicted Fe-Mo cluster-binding NifX family protein
MIVAVCSNKKDFEGSVCGSFGKAKYIFVADTKRRVVKIIDNKNFSKLKIGGDVKTAELLIKLKVTKIGVKEINDDVLKIFEDAGVEVFKDVSGTVREIIDHLSAI